MLDLNAKDWQEFTGGFRVTYDASKALNSLESLSEPDERILDELWENLYHQGDVGIASYASIPHILRIFRAKEWVNYHLPGLVVAVEHARINGDNPELPNWLEKDYFGAVQGTIQYCLLHAGKVTDKNFSRGVLMLAAVLLNDGGAYAMLDEVSIGDEERVVELYYRHG